MNVRIQEKPFQCLAAEIIHARNIHMNEVTHYSLKISLKCTPDNNSDFQYPGTSTTTVLPTFPRTVLLKGADLAS